MLFGIHYILFVVIKVYKSHIGGCNVEDANMSMFIYIVIIIHKQTSKKHHYELFKLLFY